MFFSDHSTIRAAQRNLSLEEIAYVIEFGKRFHKSGAVIYYLRRRDIPIDDAGKDDICRLVGTAVILAPDEETLLTVWRNRRSGLKNIRRKETYTRQQAYR